MQDPMPSGWFPDPLGRYDHRYFNGRTWTPDVSSGGQRLVDPLGVAPGPAGTGSTTGKRSNGAATASVVLGSIGLVVAWIPFLVVIGFVLAVLAIVFGTRGLGRSRETGVGRAASISGTVMGVLGIGASIVGVWLSVLVWNEVVDFVEPGDHEVRGVSCAIDGRDVRVTGVIDNQSDDVRSYTVFVEIDGRSDVAVVDDVPAGEPAGWSAEVTARSVQDDCTPEITVQGPFPFGLEMDPVNDSISP